MGSSLCQVSERVCYPLPYQYIISAQESKLKPVIMIFKRTGPKHTIRLMLLSVISFLGIAYAHPTIVLGTVYSDPVTPQPNESFTISLVMVFPTQVPVADAVVNLEFSTPGQATIRTEELTEVEEGRYETQVTLPQAGSYTLMIRDTTYRQEETTASLTFLVGEGENDDAIPFVLPPTVVGADLQTWLVWLIAVPVIAGVVVTILVMMNNPGQTSEEEA
jgi:hypothetical protein